MSVRIALLLLALTALTGWIHGSGSSSTGNLLTDQSGNLLTDVSGNLLTQ